MPNPTTRSNTRPNPQGHAVPIVDPSAADPSSPTRLTLEIQAPGTLVFGPAGTTVAGSDSVLAANLARLARQSGPAARAILAAEPRMDLELTRADDGAWTGVCDGRRLASARRPLDEAERFAESIDVGKSAAVVVSGFGLGHHVAALARRLKQTGVIIVFEPDAALLRRALSTIDCTPWLATTRVVLVTGEDEASVATATAGLEGVLAAGTAFVDHPPSRARLGDRGPRFAASFAKVMRAVRTNIVTTLVHVDLTLRNVFGNIAAYLASPGIIDLKGAARGRPAVVVSAGPSLRRNLDVLARPGVRDRFVLIAAQTVLKPMLERGIRPHFVAALDYADISTRFYEGLTAADVEGVTLVAEAKANPAIFAAYPGRVRMPAEPILDELLGEEFARERGTITPGATVAHLSYYLARYLGADPVVLVGQDLAFTDGQYYSAGAAIHRVWSGELNEFNTLEMLEWQRIVRMRRTLHKAEDHLGRPVYTDEQMATYLVQFEREFASDASRGLRVIDATEGGVRKRHAEVSSLASVVGGHAGAEPITLPEFPRVSVPSAARTMSRVRAVRDDAARVRECCERAAELLREMRDLAAGPTPDRARVNRLIKRVHEIGERARGIEPAHSLTQFLNQTGILNRFKADRAIELDGTLSAEDRQRRQIERDLTNVTWLGESAGELHAMLSDATARLEGGPATPVRGTPARGKSADPAVVVKPPRRVWAVIAADPAIGGLGAARRLSTPIAGVNALARTVGRLLRAEGLTGVAVLASDAASARDLLGELADDRRVRVLEADLAELSQRREGVRAGRLWSRACWRGGLGNLTAWDEAFAPRATADALARLDADAAVVVGADWPLIDPGLLGEMIARYQRPWAEGGSERFVFTHASPGLGGCLLDRDLVSQLASASASSGPWASIGALLAYVPMAPQADPLGKGVCVAAPPAARDAAVRAIADGPAGVAVIEAALARTDERTDAAQLGAILAAAASRDAGPEIVEFELTHADGHMPAEDARRLIDELASWRSDAAVTLGGDEATAHPRWAELARHAIARGLAAHLRTGRADDAPLAAEILASGVDVVSVHVPAELCHRENLLIVELLRHRGEAPSGLPTPWIVPRLTRCDAVYEKIEAFYDAWLARAGAAVIDPLPAPREGERIEPLPPPACVAERRARTELRVSPADAGRSLRELWSRAGGGAGLGVGGEG